MKFRAFGRIAVLCIFVGSILFGAAAAAFSEEEVYTATMSARRGIGSKDALLTLTVTERSTEEDTERLTKILEEKGSEALFKELRSMNRGTARIEGTQPRTLNHVRVYPGENGSRVIIVADGPLRFPQDQLDPDDPRRHTDALGFIEIVLNNAGKGGGSIAEAVGVSFGDDGVLHIQGTASQITLKDVVRVK